MCLLYCDSDLIKVLLFKILQIFEYAQINSLIRIAY
jgi:hypothetical protein